MESGVMRAFLAVALSLAPGCDEPAAAKQAEPPPFEVSVVTVQPRDLPWSPVHLAQTSASREVEVRSRIEGIVVDRTFVEGARVEAGQVLFHIDPRTFEAAVQEARARNVEAKARIDETERTVARKQALVDTQSVARRELDDAITARELAKAQLAIVEAQLAQAELDLEYTTVKAPLAGRIGKVIRETGSLVDSSANSLLTTVWQLDPIYASFRISEREHLAWQKALEAGAIAVPGSEDDLRVALELIDGSPFPGEGRINFRSVQIDPSTGTAEVRAEFPNPDEKLLPGQFVRARVLGEVRRGALSVPQRAVLMGPGSAFVYVAGEGDVVEARDVVVSDWEESDWIVESGLTGGERVIVDGLQKIRPGAHVKPVELAKKD
jgi:membrane fusion protein (multidrug efflux system)